ncbi:YicC/YloC family endoribonuclease [Gymnodinialimonas hymeniacidonis]|uniref:YicC/YloC family endoribonuclease n=1 Tax=Gymnodinialimonas hymeniacidonis TaxID=3126508 RepID=UPI0034C5F7BE
MTAFAASDGSDGPLSWQWEIRGVNGRGLDLRLRLPDGLGALEQPLRAALQKALTRGNVSLSLKLQRAAGGAALALQAEALDAALAALATVEERADGALAASSAADILALRGVFEASDTLHVPEVSNLMPEAEALIAAFVDMRRGEGAALAQVMSAQLDRIAELTEAASETATLRAAAAGTRLRQQVAELLEATEVVDEARLAQELAVLAVKADVTEELDRLRAHVKAARDLIAGGGAVGRKLDFLMQEFNREANTLCSKSGDAALTAIGLDLKLTIDQMREQVQNVE